MSDRVLTLAMIAVTFGVDEESVRSTMIVWPSLLPPVYDGRTPIGAKESDLAGMSPENQIRFSSECRDGMATTARHEENRKRDSAMRAKLDALRAKESK